MEQRAISNALQGNTPSIVGSPLSHLVPGSFSDAATLKVGNGKLVRFWQDKWCDPWKFMEIFPKLFEVAEDQFITVADAGIWSENCWKWSPNLCRQFLVDEQADAALLENTMSSIFLDKQRDDAWTWMLDISHSYKVKSTYDHLVRRSAELEILGICMENVHELPTNTI